MRSDLSRLVREAWQATERLPAPTDRPAWTDTGLSRSGSGAALGGDCDLGARLARLARIAAAVHLGRSARLQFDAAQFLSATPSSLDPGASR